MERTGEHEQGTQHETRGEDGFTYHAERPSAQQAATALRERTLAEVANIFTYRPPRSDQISRYEALRARAKELAELIVELTPASREQSLALTYLHLGVMLANASIACNEPA